MAIRQHLSKTRQPLSTLDMITISVNGWQTSGMSGKNSKHKIAETRTDSSGGGSVGSERCKLAIFPTWSLIYQVFGMAQTSANASVLVISPLNSIVEEQAREINGLGPMRPVLWTPSSKDLEWEVSNDFRFSWRLLMQRSWKQRNPTRNISLLVIEECHTVDAW